MFTEKKLIVAAVALAASSLSFAQSAVPSNGEGGTQVNLYGVVDANVQVLNGKSTLTRVQSGGLQSSRIGLRGREDLGGGLSAFFVLESGINLDDGSYGQNAFWGRQALVGLASPYGTVSLGRQYGSLYDLSNEFSIFSNIGYGASTGVIGGFGGYEPVRGSDASGTGNGGPSRLNNSVKYETPSINGFKAGALVGLGEVAGGTNETRVLDLYGRYTKDNIDGMVSYVSDKRADLGLDRQTTSAAAAYRINDTYRVTGGVISVDDRSINNIDGIGYWIGGDYRVGPHTFKTQYVESKLRHGDEGKTQAYGIGYQYDLSKRTALYSSLTYFKNSGDNYTPRTAGILPTGVATIGDGNVTELVTGIRHSF
ncbi:MAG: porin [Burkholderiaceae bacterium]